MSAVKGLRLTVVLATLAHHVMTCNQGGTTSPLPESAGWPSVPVKPSLAAWLTQSAIDTFDMPCPLLRKVDRQDCFNS